jgi:uncharacterized protein YeaO (DUF488 family)
MGSPLISHQRKAPQAILRLHSESRRVMLSRYTIERGKKPSVVGVRQDARKHTRHCLRPTAEMVMRFLDAADDYGWREFRAEYLALLRSRFQDDPLPFEKLAERAQRENVYLGCSCPTKKNPDVRHCHTMLALEFMAKRFPRLKVVMTTHN